MNGTGPDDGAAVSGEGSAANLGPGKPDDRSGSLGDAASVGLGTTVKPSEPDLRPSFISLLPDVWPRVDDGLQISGGGAVAVDTDTLRATAARFAGAAAELSFVVDAVGPLSGMLGAAQGYAADAHASVMGLAKRLRETEDGAARIVIALREAAVMYEMVELNVAHRAAVFAGDTASATRLDARLDRLRDEHPDAWLGALGAEFGRTVMWPSELVRQGTETGVHIGAEFGDPVAIGAGAAVGLATLGLAAGFGMAGTGRLSRESRLNGAAGPVAVTAVAPVRASGAPQSLADVTERMPGAGDSRVRVEKYTMPDGTRQFAVYVAGTQSLALGGDDPWDNRSNAQLYTGSVSDSYAATQQALSDAGARRGDVVHAFGHSQGAMITAHLALESGYETRTLVSFGSPVEADVGSGTLSVGIRHTDDPVAALAGGGHIAAVGAPGSFVAERVSHTATGIDDLAVPAHRMTAYAETAALVDASADPRVDGLRATFAELADAESVRVTEYAATRAEVSPASSDGG